MKGTIATLTQTMKAAAAALNYEEAGRCRDMISLIRGGATADEALKADVSGLDRPRPGAMGLGTSQQKMMPPPGCQPPIKSDPMTKGRNSQGGKRK